jgi:Fe-S cluster assembly protein SufD
MTISVSPSPVPNSTELNLATTLPQPDAYLNELLDTLSTVKTEGWLQSLRDRALDRARQLALPTTRDEEWRFTDLSPLRQVKFNVQKYYDTSSLKPEFWPETANSRLVFVNGVFAPELSTITYGTSSLREAAKSASTAIASLPKEVVVSNLANLPADRSQRLQKYLAQSEGAQEVFTALNTAGINDVAVIWVPENTVVETPLHVVFLSTGDVPIISLPRCLVIAETAAQVTVIEEYKNYKETKSAEEEVYFTNGVTEIFVEENAKVIHTRLQWDSAEAFHIGKTAVTQARYSRYTCNAISLGAKLSRHNLEILQTGAQTETILNGLTIITGKQLADTHSAIAFNCPGGIGRQIHKTIVSDRAHAVFNGKIFVPKSAFLTDASQLNRNLLLSSKARVDTKPQLEITADNVKCSHGATVSQLEDDAIFYLQSRGINEKNARSLLISAFAAEIINQIPLDSERQKLAQFVNSLRTDS